jgi:hypothetical protein
MTEIKKIVLSIDKNFVFGNSVERFFKKYRINQDIEIYKFFYDRCYTNYEDLKNIDYKAEIIFWVTNDSFDDENWCFNEKTRVELKKIETICSNYPDKIFILCSWQFNLNRFVSAKNLFVINLVNVLFKQKNRYKRCNNKVFKEKKWICLNNAMMPHRIALVSYLLSLGFDKKGLITAEHDYYFVAVDGDFNAEYEIKKKHYLNSVIDLFDFSNKEEKIRYNFNKLFSHNFDKIEMSMGEHNYIKNYHFLSENAYRYTALEIISCSSFLDPSPVFGEKEIQNIYAQNFPIYVSSQNTAGIMKNVYGFDIFEDIVDHSYDSIEDPAERLTAAIDRNIHLLDGTIDIESLWYENQHRFEKNCDLADNLYFNQSYQYKVDEKQIKLALDHFGIKYTKVKKSKSS